MFALGQLWLERRARATSEDYGDHPDAAPHADRALRERAAGEGFDITEMSAEARPAELPPLMLAALPLVTVIAINLAFTALVIPAMDTDYLAAPKYGATTIDSVRGICSLPFMRPRCLSLTQQLDPIKGGRSIGLSFAAPPIVVVLATDLQTRRGGACAAAQHLYQCASKYGSTDHLDIVPTAS